MKSRFKNYIQASVKFVFPIKCLIGCLLAYTSFHLSLPQLCSFFISMVMRGANFILNWVFTSDTACVYPSIVFFTLWIHRNLLCNYSVIIIIIIVIVIATYSPSILCAQINHISRMLRVALVVCLMQITYLNSLFRRGYILCICMWWNASIFSWCCAHTKKMTQCNFHLISSPTLQKPHFYVSDQTI